MKRQGKRVTWVLCGAALLLLVAAVFAGGDWFRGHWYLRQLRVGTAEEQVFAAKRLGELGVVKAIPDLFARLPRDRDVISRIAAENAENAENAFSMALRRIVKTRGRLALPYVNEGIGRESGHRRLSAIQLLSELKAGAAVAVKNLTEAVRSDPEDAVRLAAAAALGWIGRPAAPAAPVLIGYLKENFAAKTMEAQPALGRSVVCGTSMQPGTFTNTESNSFSHREFTGPGPTILDAVVTLAEAAPEAVFTALETETWELSQAVLEKLRENGKTATVLAALDSPRAAVRRMAVWALGELPTRDDRVTAKLTERL